MIPTISQDGTYPYLYTPQTETVLKSNFCSKQEITNKPTIASQFDNTINKITWRNRIHKSNDYPVSDPECGSLNANYN